MFTRISFCIAPAVMAIYMPMCTPKIRPTVMPSQTRLAELWTDPIDLAERDLFYGPWGVERAPDPDAVYSFIAVKQRGTNPGVIVSDPHGREWHVKQPAVNDQGAEGPVEVVLSRVLSAVGYHQPPVYFVPSFTIRDERGTRVASGGRFRLHTDAMKKLGDWEWQQNPFVGTKPFQGLIAILLMFNSSDLKNVNNALYQIKQPDGSVEQQYVVRDLGTALGETAKLFPRRGNIDLFERSPFITGVQDGYVVFNYHGWHQEILRRRITTADLQWAAELLGRLSDDQWMDAFRAGGYDAPIAERFVRQLKARIADGKGIGSARRQASGGSGSTVASCSSGLGSDEGGSLAGNVSASVSSSAVSRIRRSSSGV